MVKIFNAYVDENKSQPGRCEQLMLSYKPDLCGIICLLSGVEPDSV